MTAYRATFVDIAVVKLYIIHRINNCAPKKIDLPAEID